jgi:hypothetical protein
MSDELFGSIEKAPDDHPIFKALDHIESALDELPAERRRKRGGLSQAFSTVSDGGGAAINGRPTGRSAGF